jgi:hypothetical protein
MTRPAARPDGAPARGWRVRADVAAGRASIRDQPNSRATGGLLKVAAASAIASPIQKQTIQVRDIAPPARVDPAPRSGSQ